MRFLAPTTTDTVRLSTLDRRWRSRRNRWGDRPEIDFAVSSPWRLLDEADRARIEALVEQNRHRAYDAGRSVSLRGVDALQTLFGAPALARICSAIAGVPLVQHPMRLEHCHVNLQPRETGRPVDTWHQDYVPFVLVCVIARSGGPPAGEPGSGRLVLRDGPSLCLEPGEAVLMQGIHVWHMAERVVGGDRISAVVSWAPASGDHVDGSRLFAGKPPFDPAEPIFEQFTAYRRAALSALARRLADATDDDTRAWLLRRMRFEQARLDEATGAAGPRPGPGWTPRRRGSPLSRD